MARLLEGFYSLAAKINKVKGEETPETQEGVISDELPELKLEMSDDDLLDLSKSWEKKWNNSEAKIEFEKKAEENERYWKGQQFSPAEENSTKRPLVDNVLFEAFETMLPMVTRKNPDPVVVSDNTPEGIALSQRVSKMLVYLADILKLRLKMKTVARNWGLYSLGVGKMGWSVKENEIAIVAIRPQKLILDPDGSIVEGEYTGEYIGEVRRDTAKNLIERFPSKKKYISNKVNGKLGTSINYKEWWTNDMLFWTLEGEVLDKVRNPHWNYDEEKVLIDEFGVPQEETVPGLNHFPAPKIPYLFLSVFNLGKGPIDETTLMTQNLANQDLVNKRQRQIDKNSDGINGGWAISGEKSGLSKEQASQALKAFRSGGGVYVPRGNISDAVQRMIGQGLPADVFNQLADSRNEIRNNFGVRGSSPQGTISEQTVRGKIITQGQDANRNTFISDYLEQFADDAFNWMVQMMYVYYDEPHYAAVVGAQAANEVIALRSADMNRKLRVSVKEGSMIPEDELTRRNEAIDLWSANAISPVELYEKLQIANPRESAKNLLTWQMVQKGLLPPQVMFPDFVAPAVPMGSPQGGQVPQKPKGEEQSLLGSVPIQ